LLDTLRKRLQLARRARLLRALERPPQPMTLAQETLLDTLAQFGDAG